MAEFTFLLDKNTHDFRMDPITLTLALTSGSAETLAQRIKTELQTYLGEYVLNVRKGLPYFAEITKKNPNMSAIRGLLLAKITSIQGVKRVVSLECTRGSDQVLRVKFSVIGHTTGSTTVEGEI